MAQLNDLNLDRNLYKAPLEGETWDASIIAAQNADNPIDPIATGNAATDINQGTVTVDGAQLTPGSPIPQSAFNIANLGWTQTSAFTSASLNTVTWTSGIFTSADGVSRSISSGTTGTMAALTYIYLNINVSSTAYQITTNQNDVIGQGKVLIAVAQNQTDVATFNTVQTELITANNIFVNSLSAISANLGTITAGSININNKASIDSSGNSTFSSVGILNQYTAGENVAIGTLLCFKNTFAAWGDYSGASRNTTGVCTAMTYVSSDTGEANTNFGAATLCYIGTKGSGSGETLLKLNIASLLPAWNELDTINLRLYCVFADVSATGNLYLKLVTSAWAENTVTWNTKPTNDGIAQAIGTVVVESFAGEINAISASGAATGYIDFDITEIYRLISLGTYTNNGFLLTTGGACSNVRFGGRTRTGGGDFNQAPFIVSYITKDNPGSGNTIVANDGKVYEASNSNYQRVKQLAGVCGGTVLAGATCDVYSLAGGLCIPPSVLTVTNNQDYFLNSSTGTIGVLTNNILESNKWDIKIGTGSPRGLIIDMDKRPLFIRKYVSPDANGVNRQLSLLPPPSCSTVLLTWDASSNSQGAGQIQLLKGFLTSAKSTYEEAGTIQGTTLIWTTGTTGLITTSFQTVTNPSTVIYFYK